IHSRSNPLKMKRRGVRLVAFLVGFHFGVLGRSFESKLETHKMSCACLGEIRCIQEAEDKAVTGGDRIEHQAWLVSLRTVMSNQDAGNVGMKHVDRFLS